MWESGESVGIPSHPGKLCSLGRVTAPSSALELMCFWKWKNIGGKKKKPPGSVSSWGSNLFKKSKFWFLQCILDGGERNKNRLWRFSHLEHWHTIGSAFLGSCQTRNFGMSFYRYLSRRAEFGLQLNCKVKPLLWYAEMALDFLLLMIRCQALKLNEL